MPALKINKKTHFNIWYVLLAVWGIFFLHDTIVTLSSTQQIPYSEFLKFAQQGKLEDVVIDKDSVRGLFKEEPGTSQAKRFISVRVDPELAEELTRFNVTYRGVIESTFFKDILSWVIPSLIFFGLWIFIMRKLSSQTGAGGSFLAIGKSKAKIYVEESTKVTLADVAGVDEAKEELQEIITFLKDPTAYGRLGGRLPKGILLVGPPGTGKTLLARAVAGEAGVPFFSISGSEFVEMFVGVGAARVRDLFEQARLKAPCIVFIDELDALGRARGLSTLGAGNDEKEQTLNQLLSELDGFDTSLGVVLLAATNRPEILDPALLRAGRFDRQILVDKPDKTGRIQILSIHSKKISMSPEVGLEQIAALTPGFSGADLANLINEAALLATRRDGKSVTMDDFTSAIERIVAGLERKNRILSPQERKLVAHHEMGHALVALSLKGTDPVVKISIIPRGIGALGYTIQRPLEDRYVMSMEELKNKMVVLLGGRAAEHLIFGSFSTGAADDLSRVTEIARNMIMRYGMDQKLGPVAYESEPSSPFYSALNYPAMRPRLYSEETAHEIDRAVRARIDQAFEEALTILSERKALLERGAQLLLERETLSQNDLQELIMHDSNAGEIKAIAV